MKSPKKHSITKTRKKMYEALNEFVNRR